jgi:O-antigen ligase
VTADLLARLGGPVAAGGLVLLVLAFPRWARLLGLGLWVAGMALFVPLLAPSGDRLPLLAGAVLAALAAVALGILFRRHPWALAFLALAAAPARIPVTVGDVSANLLLPLYAVVGGAAVAFAWGLWRGEGPRRELRAVSWPLALLVAWIGLSVLWSDDLKRGAVQLFFFFLPFALLTVALARLPWSDVAVAWLCRLFLAMALVFAAVGVWQWVTKDLFWNPKVMAGNAYARFFRVNSVFWDPSMYGRFVAVAILVALVLLLLGLWRRYDAVLGLAIPTLWVGLLFSFSQSSFAALVAGILIVGALAWRWRAAAAVGVTVTLLVLLGVSAPKLQEVRSSTVAAASASKLNRATGGRFDLIWNGVKIAADHPLIGVGVGSFTRAYRERVDVPQRIKEPASHNTPVTVAAETGAVGLVLFGWLVAASLLAAFRTAGTRWASRRIAGIVAGVGLSAIFVHSLSYNAFFEDPLVWGFFALIALAATERAAGARGEVTTP